MLVYDVSRIARLISFATIFVTAISTANATSFSLSGGVTQNLLSNFNPAGWDQPTNNNVGAGTEISVFSDANSAGGLSIDGPATILFTFLGTEAGYDNSAFLAARSFS